MGRKKLIEQQQVLLRHVSFRVTEEDWNKLDRIKRNSDCRTIGEVVRRILSSQQIIYFHKDATMDLPMENLSTIREEIRRIGININQVTRHFNASKSDGQKHGYASKIAEQFGAVESKISVLLSLISQLSKKWLQG